jgi:hypothetical protein
MEDYMHIDHVAEAASSMLSIPSWPMDNYEDSFLDLESLSNLCQEDMAYLKSNGCLDVPQETERDEFVRQYFLFVHPCLPIIDEAEFWHMYQRNNKQSKPSKKFSILVFQALLLASCPVWLPCRDFFCPHHP